MPSMDITRPPPSPDRPPIPMRKRFGRFSPKTKLFAIKRGSADSAIAGLDVPPSAGLPIREMNQLRSPSTDENPFAGSQPHIGLPPDLSDAKWLHYVESNTQGGMLERQLSEEDNRGMGAVPKPMRKRRPPPIIPELSHLRTGRQSLDSSSSGSAPNSASTTASMRRQAKTPVFRIGQLEQKSGHVKEARLTKTSSVERIAEQYNAFLEHRDALEEEELHLEDDAVTSVYSTVDNHSEPSLPRPLNAGSLRRHVPRQMSEDSKLNIVLEPVRQSRLMHNLPDTPVDEIHEGEPIYFRPVSFSPDEGTMPSETFPTVSAKPSTLVQSQSPDSLSLQICLDLLKRELTPKSPAEQSSRKSSDASALQIWVMIEAYERLQNQVAQMGLGESDKRNMDFMLKGWLDTLYRVHGEMRTRPGVRDSDLEGMQEALD